MPLLFESIPRSVPNPGSAGRDATSNEILWREVVGESP